MFKKIFWKLDIKSQLFTLTSETFASSMLPFLGTCSSHCPACCVLPCGVLCSNSLCCFTLSHSILLLLLMWQIPIHSLRPSSLSKTTSSFELLKFLIYNPATAYSLYLHIHLLFMLLFSTNLSAS